jgi:C4-dicarboxylate transporter DctM subunit
LKPCRAWLPFLGIIVIIMVALYGGWATPSEVAGIGAFASLLMVILIYGCWRWADMKAILGGTVRESTMVMMILAMSFLYTYVMSYLHITQEVAAWMVGLPLGKWGFFVAVNILLVVLGFFLPPVAIILMVTPIILPALKAHGIDLVWFGVIMTILMEMGLIHPPVGLNLFVINSIAPDIKLSDIIWGTAALHRPDGARPSSCWPLPGHRDVAAVAVQRFLSHWKDHHERTAPPSVG